ncbi:universal stress protein [Oleiphilus messinensis]|uniref:Universal stress protein n=1 Tax=Oleiphilus messinensis TaxID=141451 RepID=A0A1Y0I7U3_9GAMM|nr:universal stress protein [Oleiphilus messinensis]ARU56568.1 universal stress protein [Oleiphilus messinensis]
MTGYKRILAAVDLSAESEQVIAKAKQIQSNCENTSLQLLHTLEPLGYAYGGDIPMDLTEVQNQLTEHAESQMKALGERYGISNDCLHVALGRPETEIHRFADEHNIDLVVVGSHGRHGLSLLLGSTANGVLHGAKCDILAVRIQEH